MKSFLLKNPELLFFVQKLFYANLINIFKLKFEIQLIKSKLLPQKYKCGQLDSKNYIMYQYL